nr:peptidase M28 [Solirubrobacterales bacterium]
MADERDWLRERLEELERIDRPSASEGERRAAEWLVERFAELGAEARIEAEPAHGTYWWPLGIGAGLGALGAIAALR